MKFTCPHCQHHSSDWIKSGDRVVCPKCYRFTFVEDAMVCHPSPLPSDLPPGFEMLFDNLHR